MTKRSLQALVKKAQRGLKHIADSLDNYEELFVDNKINRRDLEELYGLYFLQIENEFERIIEEMFLGMLSNNYKHTKRTKPKLYFHNKAFAKNIVLGEKKYLEWLPYGEKTEQRSKIYFVEDKNPFSLVTVDQQYKDSLREMPVIRNVIAHKSTYAYNRFRDEVLSKYSLTRSERSVGGFLRSIHSLPSTRRIEVYSTTVIAIVKGIEVKC